MSVLEILTFTRFCSHALGSKVARSHALGCLLFRLGHSAVVCESHSVPTSLFSMAIYQLLSRGYRIWKRGDCYKLLPELWILWCCNCGLKPWVSWPYLRFGLGFMRFSMILRQILHWPTSMMIWWVSTQSHKTDFWTPLIHWSWNGHQSMEKWHCQ